MEKNVTKKGRSLVAQPGSGTRHLQAAQVLTQTCEDEADHTLACGFLLRLLFRYLLTHTSGISLRPRRLTSRGRRRVRAKPAPEHLWILEWDILRRSSRMISVALSHGPNVPTSENKQQQLRPG